MGGSGSLNSNNERFVTGPYSGPVDSTRVSVVKFPDGDVQVSGCHRPTSEGHRQRPAATEKEKLKKASDRARGELLKVCKYFQLDHMWTVTYRGPQRSRSQLFVDLHKFERIVRQTYPDFLMVGVPELHRGGGVNDGGFHFHFAVHGFLDVAVLRAAWWQVVGEAQGNVQVESRCQLKTDAVARYLTKYISKSLGDGRDKGQHRYRRSQNLKVPVEKIVFHGSRGTEREQALKAWIVVASGRSIIFEWHSEDGLQFVYRTFR